MRVVILISSLLCYMEWGSGNSAFLFEGEYTLLAGKDYLDSFSNPIVLVPFIGQLLIIASFFIPRYSRKLAVTGIILLSLLVLMILVAGILSVNWKSILSTIPFIVLSLFYIFKSSKFKIQHTDPYGLR